MSSSAHQSEDEDEEVLQVEGRPRRTRRAPTNQDSDDQAGPSRTGGGGDDPSEDDDDDDDFRAARSAQPRGRGRPRGRPRGRGRGRGGARVRPPRISELKWVPGDGLGPDGDDSPMPTTMMVGTKEYQFKEDELVLPDDPVGDKKIDAKGNLLGGREFKARTFTSPFRKDPTKIYMLSIDAAKTCGYRDSLYFFRRNKELVKLNLAGEEKDMLIRDRRLNGTFKARSVTMIAVRNAFKLQGSKMIKNARYVTDDYYEDAARERCKEEGIEPNAPVGDLPDPMSHLESRQLNPTGSSRFAPNQPFYIPGGPTTHFPSSGLDPFSEAKAAHKRLILQKEGFTPENWMLKFALEVREKNAEMGRQRRERMEDVREGFMWDRTERPASSSDPTSTSINGQPTAGTAVEALKADDKGKGREGTSSPLTPLAPALDGSGSFEADLSARPFKRRRQGGPTLGVYEPETHIPQVHFSTQPTTASLTRLSSIPSFTPHDPLSPTFALSTEPSSEGGRPAFAHLAGMGGSRVGGDAWGLASVSYEMDLDGAEMRGKGVLLK